jgi:predicted phage replisome organizer
MPEVKWIKVLTDIFEDEKIRLIQSMPEGDALMVLWLKLLTQAGKSNCGGYLRMNKHIPYTPEMLSVIFGKSIQIINLALNTFEQFGMIQNTEQGIFITNWDKHQNIEGLDKIREQTRLRMQKYRAKKALPPGKDYVTRNGDVTVTQGDATELDIDKKKKKNKKEPEPKIHYAEFVSLTEKQYATLIDEHGQAFVDKCVEVLNNYKASSGKKYKSDYHTILNWVIKRVGGEVPSKQQPTAKKVYE